MWLAQVYLVISRCLQVLQEAPRQSHEWRGARPEGGLRHPSGSCHLMTRTCWMARHLSQCSPQRAELI